MTCSPQCPGHRPLHLSLTKRAGARCGNALWVATPVASEEGDLCLRGMDRRPTVRTAAASTLLGSQPAASPQQTLAKDGAALPAALGAQEVHQVAGPQHGPRIRGKRRQEHSRDLHVGAQAHEAC